MEIITGGENIDKIIRTFSLNHIFNSILAQRSHKTLTLCLKAPFIGSLLNKNALRKK